MNENKVMEHLELPPKQGNKLENIFLGVLVVTLISAIVIHVTDFNPFITQFNQGTKIVGEIISSENEVKIKRYGAIIWTEHDGNIYENSQLMTGDKSSATLKIDDQEVTVASNTIIEFKKKDTLNTLIDIQEGDIGVKGHTNKVSYTVNNQSVESKDNKSSFSLSSEGIKKSAGVAIKKVEVAKPIVIQPPAPLTKNLIMALPSAGEVFEGTKNTVEFSWTGHERQPVTIEISKDQNFKEPSLFKKKVNIPRQKIELEGEGTIYWRIWLSDSLSDAPKRSFIFKKPGEGKIVIKRNPLLGKSNIVTLEHSSDKPVFLELSRSKTFKKLEKRLKVKKKSQKVRLNFLGERFLRLVDESNTAIGPTKKLKINPDKQKVKMSYLQNRNLLKMTWNDHVKKVPELYYLLSISGQNSSKDIESISPGAEFELPQTGEYTARLYAKEKGTKGLLLSTKKIQYKRIEKKAPAKKPEALKLKKEIIIK